MMSTILDSNVVLDVLGDKPDWKAWSMKWIDRCKQDGPLVLNAITFAEVAAEFQSFQSAAGLLEVIGLVHEHIPVQSAYRAGHAHKAYRTAGGMRERVLPDFLIGAHAFVSGHRILTRDGARYRTYFPSVDIIAPDTNP
jgi:predicted nucleic acid-binding protein